MVAILTERGLMFSYPISIDHVLHMRPVSRYGENQSNEVIVEDSLRGIFTIQ